MSELTDRFGNKHQVGLIGVSRAGVEFRRSSPVTAVVDAFRETGKMIGGTLYALGEMVMGYREHGRARRTFAHRADVGRDRERRPRSR